MILTTMYNKINSRNIYNPPDMLVENTYLIKLEMVDGSSQLVQITKEQAMALGIDLADPVINESNKGIVQAENVAATTPVRTAPVNITISPAKPQGPASRTKYNYKVIHPEDLNLRPNIPVPSLALPRGRPRKRENEVVEPKVEPPRKIVKTARTRSGRITRPPIHMEKDFKVIITEEEKDSTKPKEITVAEFEPLTTNKTNGTELKPPDLVAEPQKKKKRPIASQYRCATCHKAYLGRNRMALHLKKHPDHGVGQQNITEDCEVWCFFIETALKAKDGHKGTKFCKELINLVKNARTLVKYFFKTAKEGKAEYKVDDFLAEILHLKVGEYRFNENELCKDVSIFSFLEFFDNTLIKIESSQNKKEDGLNLNVQTPPEEVVKHTPVDCNVDLSHKANVDLHFGSDIMDVIKENSPKSFTESHTVKETDFTNIINVIENDKTDKPKGTNFNLFEYTNNFKESGLFDCTNLYIDKNILHSDSKTGDYNHIFNTDKKSGDNEKIEQVDSKSKDSNLICGAPKDDFGNMFDGFYMNDHKTIDDPIVGSLVSNGKNKSESERSQNFVNSLEKKDFNHIFNYTPDKDKMNPNCAKNDDLFSCHKGYDLYLNDLKNNPESNLTLIPKNELIEKPDKGGKQLDIFRNTIQNILSIGASDEHMITILANEEKNDSPHKKDSSHNPEHEDFTILNSKKVDHFDIHKLHLLPEELMLPEGGTVGNMDTSTNSDDINVDQFVNERFKKLTGVDGEIQPGTLPLDLNNLECCVLDFQTD